LQEGLVYTQSLHTYYMIMSYMRVFPEQDQNKNSLKKNCVKLGEKGVWGGWVWLLLAYCTITHFFYDVLFACYINI